MKTCEKCRKSQEFPHVDWCMCHGQRPFNFSGSIVSGSIQFRSQNKSRSFLLYQLTGEIPIQGTITEWNDERGFGRISTDYSPRKIFFHISGITGTKRRPAIGDAVRFETKEDEQGRLEAFKIHYLHGTSFREPLHRRTSGLPGFHTIVFTLAAALTISMLYAVIWLQFPWQKLFMYPLMSLVSIVLYAIDKARAKAKGWRIRESTFHYVSLFGGWPGAYFAQQTFRHKSSKASFQVVFLLVTFLNVVLFTVAVNSEKITLAVNSEKFFKPRPQQPVSTQNQDADERRDYGIKIVPQRSSNSRQ